MPLHFHPIPNLDLWIFLQNFPCSATGIITGENILYPTGSEHFLPGYVYIEIPIFKFKHVSWTSKFSRPENRSAVKGRGPSESLSNKRCSLVASTEARCRIMRNKESFLCCIGQIMEFDLHQRISDAFHNPCKYVSNPSKGYGVTTRISYTC